jgi:glycine hydroxymethyltransferase
MLEQNDKEIFDLINLEENRQETEIELIASENYASLDVMEAAGSTNKYSE